MHNFEFGPTGSSGYNAPSGSESPRRHSVLSLVILIAVVAVVAALGLGAAFWALGLVFHLFGWILRVAILTAVVAFVWRRVACRRRTPV